jgi:8-oxo-dGTP pyrophosphatase MutT (NUDIX family)
VTTGAGRAVHPVDAAGLVLIRQGAAEPEVLLGRRHRRAGFLPDIYVFPGGRVDPGDALPSGFAEPVHPAVLDQLRRGSHGRPPAAFARAAIRETFEETGLLLAAPGGHPAVTAAAGAVWQAFAAQETAPGFAALDFVCRAITPTVSRRRYNTRFFLADGSLATGAPAGNGELEDLRWWPLAALPGLEIVDVTQFVLSEALRRWRQRLPVGREPGRLFCYHREVARWRIGAAGPWQPAPEEALADRRAKA